MPERQLNDEDLDRIAGGGSQEVVDRDEDTAATDPRTRRAPGDTVRLPTDASDHVAPADGDQ